MWCKLFVALIIACCQCIFSYKNARSPFYHSKLVGIKMLEGTPLPDESITVKSAFRKAAASLSAAFLFLNFHSIQPGYADSRLNAPTAAGTRVNSDSESLLRFGLPIDSKELREIQSAVEATKIDLKTRRIVFAQNDINTAKSLINKYETKIIQEIPVNHRDEALKSLARLKADIPPVLEAITTEQNSGSGSVQERKALDVAFASQDELAKELGILEELAVPDNFRRSIPPEFANLPRLNRRATVQFVIKHPDNTPYDVDGKIYETVNLKMIIDGYNAPLTGGNVVDLVKKGFYNGLQISRSDGFVVQTGDPDPEGDVHGYIPKGSDSVRTIPLEIAVKGDNDILFGSTTEDDSRGYAATVLPFQSYGALGMARTEFEADTASSQFFWLLFESDLTPAGKNMLDGRYTCFGYTVDGAESLKAVREGDIIVSAEIISGGENLEVPSGK